MKNLIYLMFVLSFIGCDSQEKKKQQTLEPEKKEQETNKPKEKWDVSLEILLNTTLSIHIPIQILREIPLTLIWIAL